MIPTIQMLPNSMLPFYSVYNMGPFQCLPQLSPINYSWSQSPVVSSFPFNCITGGVVSQPSLLVLNEYRLDSNLT